MKPMKLTLLAGALALGTLSLGALSLGPAQAETAVTDAAGMTLYTYDTDAGGVSACYDDCAVNWPPYLGKEGEKKAEGWTLAARKDGAMQWVYDGKPVYLFKGDTKAGDMNGKEKGGVWHMLME